MGEALACVRVEDSRTIVWCNNMLVFNSKGVRLLIVLELKATEYC